MAAGVEARIQSIADELQALASSPAVDPDASRQLRAAVELLEKATAGLRHRAGIREMAGLTRPSTRSASRSRT